MALLGRVDSGDFDTSARAIHGHGLASITIAVARGKVGVLQHVLSVLEVVWEADGGAPLDLERLAIGLVMGDFVFRERHVAAWLALWPRLLACIVEGVRVKVLNRLRLARLDQRPANEATEVVLAPVLDGNVVACFDFTRRAIALRCAAYDGVFLVFHTGIAIAGALTRRGHRETSVRGHTVDGDSDGRCGEQYETSEAHEEESVSWNEQQPDDASGCAHSRPWWWRRRRANKSMS